MNNIFTIDGQRIDHDRRRTGTQYDAVICESGIYFYAQRADNALLAAALEAERLEILQDAQNVQQAHRNEERRNKWRYRCLLQMGHWPDGDAAAWRRVALQHDMDTI